MDQSLNAVRFNVNGLDVELKGDFDLGKNLNSVIKSETGFKVGLLDDSARVEVVILLVTIIRLSAGHETRLFRRWLWSLRCTGGQLRRQDRSAKSNTDFGGKTTLLALCNQLELAFYYAGQVERRSINSCLCPVGSIDGCMITTSEGIGSSKKGFSQIQGLPSAFMPVFNTTTELDFCLYQGLHPLPTSAANLCHPCLQIALQNIAPRNAASAPLASLSPPTKP